MAKAAKGAKAVKTAKPKSVAKATKPAPKKKSPPAAEKPPAEQAEKKAESKTASKGAKQAAKTTKPEKANKPAAPRSVGARRTLTCELDHTGVDNDHVSLVWKLDNVEVKGGEYEISRHELRERALHLRTALAELESAAPTGAAPKQYAPALQTLATHGARLAKTALGLTGSDRTKKAAASFASWFMKNVATAPEGAFEILIVHRNIDSDGGRMYVAPWHLAFTPPDGDIDDLPAEPEAYKNFWCKQFRLVVVTKDHVRALEQASELPAGQTRIVAVLEVDGNRARSTQQSMHVDPLDRRIVSSKDELIDHMQRLPEVNHFQYVVLNHAGGGVFKLGKGFLDAQTYDDSLTKVRDESVVINVFDGDCVMRDRPEWIQPLLTRMRGGLIVSETDILQRTDRYFGWRLLKRTISKAGSLADALVESRDELFPRGLLYGFYCNARNVYVNPYADLQDMLSEIDGFLGVDDGGAA